MNPRIQFSATVAVCATLAFSTLACGGKTPASPTPADPSNTIAVSAAVVVALGLHPAAVAGAPSAPTGLQATVLGSTVTFTWTFIPGANPNASTFILEAGSSSGRSDYANFDLQSTRTSFVSSPPLFPAGTYFVRVRARNSSGSSDPSNEIVVTVGSCAGAPAAPTTLTASVAGSTVTLSWTAPIVACAAPATSYVLRAGSSAGLGDLANVDTGSATTGYTATAVPAGTYFVRVFAANGALFSAPSNEVVVTVGPTSGSLTGTWIGLAPDGLVMDASTGNCDLEYDAQLTLTQTGATLSGALYQRLRRAARSACQDRIGTIAGPWPVTGSASGGTLTLSITILGNTAVMSGAFTNTRMELTATSGIVGTMKLNRQ